MALNGCRQSISGGASKRRTYKNMHGREWGGGGAERKG